MDFSNLVVAVMLAAADQISGGDYLDDVCEISDKELMVPNEEIIKYLEERWLEQAELDYSLFNLVVRREQKEAHVRTRCPVCGDGYALDGSGDEPVVVCKGCATLGYTGAKGDDLAYATSDRK